MLRGIGRWFGYRALARRKEGHLPQRTMRSFAEVESIGMVVPGEEAATFHRVLDYAFSLRQNQQKRVFICACSERKQLPPHLADRRDVTLLRMQDLNWMGRPISTAARAFYEEPFDYLIDFTQTSILPLEWMVRLSHASLHVGFRSSACVDIHFNLPIGAGIQTQIEMLDHYLNRQG